MVNSNKCKCKECKRTISKTDMFCPYCSSPNPYAEESSGLSKKAKAVQRTPIVDDLEDFMKQEEIEDLEYGEESFSEDMEGLEEDNCDENLEDNDTDFDSDEHYEDMLDDDILTNDKQQTDEYNSYEENYGGKNRKVTEQINQSGKDKTLQDAPINFNSRDGRSPINWTDEEKPAPVDYSNIYNEDGVYNPNYDGFYNDTLPKIQNEIDSLMAGREKTILKIVFGFVAIFGIIVYLILTI